MNHTQLFLREISERAGVSDTNYGLAKAMRPYGWNRTSIMAYRRGTTVPDDKNALDIAAALDLDPSYVLACLAADRCRDEEVKGRWEKIASGLRRTAAAVILSALTFGGWGAPERALAAIDGEATDLSRYTLRAVLRRLWDSVKRFAAAGDDVLGDVL